MAKHVLILGAGLVSQPIIDYLFENSDYELTVADIVESNAVKAIHENPRGHARVLDVTDEDLMKGLVAQSDLVVSLLPYSLHPLVARHCLDQGVSMVNASYVSEELKAMDEEAREKGLLILCEIGLDPGIDHMSAMEIIHKAQNQGGQVKEFISVCGGLPAPDANDNPFGYKFSWSPKGVLLAGNNPAKYIKDQQDEVISADRLFHSTTPMTIDDEEYEAYPNRDSTPYEQIYGLEGIDLLLRGTLRYAGWHHLILALKSLQLLKDTPLEQGEDSFQKVLSRVNGLGTDNLKHDVASILGLDPDSKVIQALDWLGLFDAEAIRENEELVIDLLANQMSRKMSYQAGERDMVVLQHEFLIEYSDRQERVLSTLVDYGIPNGASSMARTVSLPVAIAVKLILENRIDLVGVQIPVDRSIYEPLLKELNQLGISFQEDVQVLQA